MIDDYNKAQEDLKKLRDDAREQVTDGKKALDLFKERFFVPFSIEPSNQEDVILNMEFWSQLTEERPGIFFFNYLWYLKKKKYVRY